MKTYRNIEDYKCNEKPLVAILGNFDGVHMGHRKLISVGKKIANDICGETMVFTFFPHPQFLFDNNFRLLNDFSLKRKILEKLGVDQLLALPFTKEISKITPQEFVDDVLAVNLCAKHIVVGFNFSFGYKGMGNPDLLSKLAEIKKIETTIIPPVYVDNELVSSTRIRKHLKNGEIEKAAQLLGYYPQLSGVVVSGHRIGSQLLGYPTANISVDNSLLIPGEGVYSVKVFTEAGRKSGILNIGYKPTVSEERELTVEVNILDFSGDLYGKTLKIVFYKKLRLEKKFSGLNELKKQLRIDEQKTREYFAENLI